jgi:DNA-binding NarL/FixJ family response regulator
MSANVVRVLLVDDHTLFRESLRRVLEGDARHRVVAEVSTVREALDLLKTGIQFDLALVDYQLAEAAREGNGLTVLRAMRENYPDVGAVLLTAGVGREQVVEAVRELRVGVFLKSDPISELQSAIDRTLNGDTWLSSGASIMLLSEPEHRSRAVEEAGFTPRELKVLRWITEGLSNKEIGSQLDVSESSVKALLQKLFEKTSVRTRSQLVRFVFESGMELP